MTTRVSRCRSCDESIVWMVTANGRKIPVDADSVDESELEWAISDRRNNRHMPLFDPQEHTSHFATCPAADHHRRPR